MMERCQYIRVGTGKVALTPTVREQLLCKIREWGTGRDTLRCLALATHDSPPRKEDMDLENSTKFAQYEVKCCHNIPYSNVETDAHLARFLYIRGTIFMNQFFCMKEKEKN